MSNEIHEVEEIWRDIDGFSKYQTSNLGNIRNIFKKSKRILSPTLKNGYFTVLLKNDLPLTILFCNTQVSVVV